ncbi:hypothetical protein B0T26DRAFT_746685 [Lasiosphaeria miniovina]|uniref:STB6-like N-terminal domain-containing protein n=1 Tax=Lasiosphaeria miniovina TaxID=1954250 RepID=A0AA40EES4_9PEZI|nr:uncharacterized protein B0T26DRAFT_746685 [Lasiosphaeria miniovina]KAK0734826.1 hypothetical protein B0T26DRAFT_746685 [Lasiosphaeria miniovina]
MSLRLPFPASALDGRAYREEDLPLARTASNRFTRPPALETAVPQHPFLSALAAAPMATAAAAAMDLAPLPPPSPQRRRVVLPDPVAFKFLEDDPSVTVVARKRVLPGYELYLVEQWVCSRQTPALVIVTYTGDPKHSVVVGVLEAPKDEKDWSQRLRVYFKAIQQYHARPKETELGELMVTNLSSFPSALTVIAVPDGDFRRHRQVFIVNEDLKRLGCSGRSGLTLSDPTPATQAKFVQLYKTSDRNTVSDAVLELIKLCQIALFIFGKLEQEYVDGLLCDVTETAISNWWTEIGSEYFNIEPTDGILGPTTIAALLGILLGARNRLSYWGAPVSKDVFDIDSTKRGVGTFQKNYKLEKTRRLDRQTLLKLHSVTAKAAAGDGGWGVQKAVKSTVAEIGGKRGELVIGMVGGRDKANIGDIETLDLDKFISLAYGERPKWLWHGKPRRTQHEQSVPAFGKELKDDNTIQSVSRRTQSAPLEDELEVKKKEDSPGVYSTSPPGSAPAMSDGPNDRDALRRTVFKSVAGKVSDARSGLGRIRDAVGGGLRGHVSRPSKDESPGPDMATGGYSTPSIAALAQSSASLTSPVAIGRAFTWKVKPEEYLAALKDKEGAEAAHIMGPAAEESESQPSTARDAPQLFHVSKTGSDEMVRDNSVESHAVEARKGIASSNGSAAGSAAEECDLPTTVPAAEPGTDVPFSFLQRRHSINGPGGAPCLNDARYPRRLSFSEAEDAILRWHEIIDITDASTDAPDVSNVLVLQAQAELAHSLYDRLHAMQTGLAPWVTAKLHGVEELDETFGGQQSDLQALYLAVDDAYQRIRHSSGELVAEERSRLTEAVKDVEVLVAKLEYEISALVGRVRDVEDGVAQFEAQVADVERRADELKTVLETESWLHWFVRTLTGIGTGPNITRGPSQRGEALDRKT